MISSTSWQPGTSGNPKGRPKKKRALTQILARAGSAAVDYDGRRVSGRRLVSILLWQAVKSMRMTLPCGRVVDVSVKEWLEICKFLFAQLDGPPRGELDITSGGQDITIQYVNDWRPLRDTIDADAT